MSSAAQERDKCQESDRPRPSTNVIVRRELLRGLGRLNVTTRVLQRTRLRPADSKAFSAERCAQQEDPR